MSAAPVGPSYPPSVPSPGPVGLDAPLYDASIGEAVSRFWRKYTVFSGRASRSEYWWWTLVATVVSVVLQMVATLLIGEDLGTALMQGGGFSAPMLLPLLWFAATLVGSVALVVRRLHDTNHSGWWYLLSVPTFAGLALQLSTLARLDDLVADGGGDPRAALVALVPGLVLMLIGAVASVVILVFTILGPDPRGARFDRPRHQQP